MNFVFNTTKTKSVFGRQPETISFEAKTKTRSSAYKHFETQPT